jgi:hypothetical protein
VKKRRGWSRLGDLSGRTFHCLLVLGPVEAPEDYAGPKSHRWYECQCRCNRLKVLPATRLVNDRAKSCGECGLRGGPWTDASLRELAEWQDLRARGWSLAAIAKLYGVHKRDVWRRQRDFEARAAREVPVWYGGLQAPRPEVPEDVPEREVA